MDGDRRTGEEGAGGVEGGSSVSDIGVNFWKLGKMAFTSDPELFPISTAEREEESDATYALWLKTGDRDLSRVVRPGPAYQNPAFVDAWLSETDVMPEALRVAHSAANRNLKTMQESLGSVQLVETTGDYVQEDLNGEPRHEDFVSFAGIVKRNEFTATAGGNVGPVSSLAPSPGLVPLTTNAPPVAVEVRGDPGRPALADTVPDVPGVESA